MGRARTARMFRVPYVVANQCSDSVTIYSHLKSSPMTTIACCGIYRITGSQSRAGLSRTLFCTILGMLLIDCSLCYKFIMPPKRSSGFEFRKRKCDKQKENKKMSKILISWTKPNLNLSQNGPSKQGIQIPYILVGK